MLLSRKVEVCIDCDNWSELKTVLSNSKGETGRYGFRYVTHKDFSGRASLDNICMMIYAKYRWGQFKYIGSPDDQFLLNCKEEILRIKGEADKSATSIVKTCVTWFHENMQGIGTDELNSIQRIEIAVSGIHPIFEV